MISEDNKVHLDFINALSKSKIKRKSVIKLNDTKTEQIENIRKQSTPTLTTPTPTVTETVQTEVSVPKEVQQEEETRKTYQEDFDKILKSYDESKKSDDSHEKKEVLYHLLRDYKDDNRGQWSMDTPLYELKYELKKRKSEEAELDNVAFIKQILVVVLHLVEFGNNKLGLLNLNGWANHVCSNLDNYKRSLRAIHLQYFRNRVSNPISELGWMIAGSMIMFHFTKQPVKDTSDKKETSEPGNKSSPNIDIGSILGVMSKFM
jgi:hypothetical protein